MKHALVFLLLALFCGAIFATDRNPTPGPSTSQSASQSNATGGSTGNAWAVALPGHGSPSYAGMYSICVRGSGFGWNLVWSWTPDLECVKMIADLERLNRTPIPPSKVELLTVATPVANQNKDLAPNIESKVASCAPPAKAKTVAAAKASGACKG